MIRARTPDGIGVHEELATAVRGVTTASLTLQEMRARVFPETLVLSASRALWIVRRRSFGERGLPLFMWSWGSHYSLHEPSMMQPHKGMVWA